MANGQRIILEFKGVSKFFDEISGDFEKVTAVDDVSFQLHEGDFTALVGPSGSGKSTLLNLASGLDQPSKGEVWISGKNIASMNSSAMGEMRKHHIGFIFQSYNLFPVLNAIENVEYTSLIRGDDPKSARERAIEALNVVGLKEKMMFTPRQLSGGQQQRVAVARALASQPDIIFADEPTANLDSKTAQQLIELFEKINHELKATFFFSTHDQRLVNRVKAAISIRDGKIIKKIQHANRMESLGFTLEDELN